MIQYVKPKKHPWCLQTDGVIKQGVLKANETGELTRVVERGKLRSEKVRQDKLGSFGFGLCNLTRSRRSSVDLVLRRLGRLCLGRFALLLDLFDAEPWHENTAYEAEGGSGHSCVKGLQRRSSVSFPYINLH